MIGLTPKEILLAAKLKKHGFVNPIITIQETKRTDCSLPLALAVLDQESSRGHMIVGHDKDRFGNYIFPAKPGVVELTHDLYKRYLKVRGSDGKGGMQGMGPGQLTWYAFQDLADSLAQKDGYPPQNGCCRPRYNIRVMCQILTFNRKDIFKTLKNYNGSEEYARIVMPKVEFWKGVVSGTRS